MYYIYGNFTKLNKIYKKYFKHQLDFIDVLNEFKQIIIKSFFNVSAGFENMCYLSKENKILYKCINIMNLNATSKQMLNTIKNVF